MTGNNPSFFRRYIVAGIILVTLIVAAQAVTQVVLQRHVQHHHDITFLSQYASPVESFLVSGRGVLLFHLGSTLIVVGAIVVYGLFVLAPVLAALRNELAQRSQALAALKESEAKYAAIVSGLPVISYSFNQSGEITSLEGNVANLLDSGFEYYLGKGVEQLLPERSELGHAAQLALAGKESYGVIESGVKALEYLARPIFDDRGGISSGVGAIFDVTLRARMERELQQQTEFATQVMEALGQGVSVANLDGVFEYVNPAYGRLLGYEPAQIVGKTPFDFTPSGDYPALLQALDSRKLGQTSTYETRLRRADGQMIHVLITGTPRFNGNEITGTIAAITDLTAQKQTEHDLRIRQRAIEASSAGIAIIDASRPDLPFIYINSAFERITGYSSEDVIDRYYRLVFSSDQDQIALNDLRAAIQEGRDCTVLMRNYRKTGEQYWNHLSIAPVRDADGKPEYFIVIVEDISERKQAELALAEERNLLAVLLDNMPDSIYFKDTASRFTRINRAQMHVLGLGDPNEALGKTDLDFQAEELAVGFMREEQEIIRTGQPLIERQEYNPLPDGQVRWFSATKVPIYAADGKITGIVGISRNITEMKLVEAQLRHQKDYLAALHETTLDLVGRLDPRSLLYEIIRRAAALVGTEHAYIYLLNDVKNRLEAVGAIGHFTDILGVELGIGEGVSGKAWQSGQPLMVSNYPEWSGRSAKLMSLAIWSVVAVPLKSGERVIGVIGMGQDKSGQDFSAEDVEILSRFANLASVALENARLYALVQEELEERLSVEAELEEERNLLRTVIDSIPDYIYAKDLDGRFILNNQAHVDLLGTTLEEAIGKTEADFLSADVAQRAQMDEGLLLLKGEPLIRVEETAVDNQGNVIWQTFSKTVLRSRDGAIIGLVGISADITERKRIEEAEREQRSLAEAFRDIAAALSSTLDLNLVLDHVLENLGRVVPHDAASIMLVEAGKARFVRQRGYDGPEFDEMARRTIQPIAGFSGVEVIIRTGNPHIIADTRQYPGWLPLLKNTEMRSYLGAAIRLEGEILGFINLDSSKVNFFAQAHADRLQIFANQTAIAIKNARLYQHAQEVAMIEERQRLARDLHDAVSQTLFSASLVAETLPRLWERSPGDVVKGLAELQRLTRGALAEMRNLLIELRHNAVMETDMSTLLKHLADAVTGHTQIQIALETKSGDLLPPEVQNTFYRVAQEALNNIVKHARARQIVVKYAYQNHYARLVIFDNGRGFDLSKPAAGHFGLTIMRERAEAAGASLTVRSQPGSGTEIELVWQASQDGTNG